MKNYKRLMSHETEQWCKVWGKTDSSFQKMTLGIDEF